MGAGGWRCALGDLWGGAGGDAEGYGKAGGEWRSERTEQQGAGMDELLIWDVVYERRPGSSETADAGGEDTE